MIVLAIVGVLAGVAVPAMRQWVARAAVADGVEAFMGSIGHARAQALRHGLPVTMCRSSDVDSAVAPACRQAEDWASGWIVFVDADDDARFDPLTGDRLLKVHAPLRTAVSIRQNVADHRPLRFSALGMMKSGVAGFAVSAAGDRSARRMVCVGLGGRARTVRDPDGLGCAV